MLPLTPLLAAIPAFAPASAPEDPFVRLELENGLTVAILFVADAPKQSFFTFLPLGLYGDGAHRAQFAHIAEHAMIRSTDPFDLHRGGVEMNGETTGSSLRLDTYAEPPVWREALARHAKWLAVREVDAEMLEREKERIAGELAATVPGGYTHKWAMAAWSQAAAAGLDHAAVRGDVMEASAERVEAYLRERMPAADRIYFVAAGPVPVEELKKAIEAELGEVPAAPPAESAPRAPEPLSTGDRRATWDLDARHYLEWYPIPGDDPSTRVAAYVLAQFASMSLATSGDPHLAGGKAAVAFDLDTPRGRAITIHVSIGEAVDVEELQSAIRARLDHPFAEGVRGFGVAGAIQQLRMQAGQLPDFATLRKQAGGRGDLVEAQTALVRSMMEIWLGLTIPEALAHLEDLDPDAVESLAATHLAAERRNSLLLEPAATGDEGR